jgi:hypothetical protein
MSGGWRRIPGRVTVSSMVAVAGWCAFAAYLVVQARLGPPLVWGDSKVYAAMAHRAVWSRALWAGARPPLTPLVLKLVGNGSAMVTAQAVVAALAWGTLAWTAGRLVASGWRRVAVTFLVLGFATTAPVAQWNRSELSESLSMSLLALVFAGFIWTARRPTWPRVAATVVACLGFAATRDAQVWTVGILALVAGTYALIALANRRGTALRAGVLAVCLLAVAALCESGTLSSDRTSPDTADVLFVRVFPFPDRVAWFADHGMPQAGRVDQLAAETPVTPGDVKVVGFSLHEPGFGPLEHWIRTEGGHTYLLWLATHPWYVVSEPLQRPERAFNFAHGDLAFYGPATHAAASPLTKLLWPPLLELLVLSALALYLGIVSEAWRAATWRVVVVLTLVGVAAMLVAWHGDGQEVTRHTVEGFAQVRLGVWLLLAMGLLGPPPVEPAAPTATEAAVPADLPDGTPRVDDVEPVGGEGGTAS